MYLQIAQNEPDEQSKSAMSDLVHALFSQSTCGDAFSEDKKMGTAIRQQVIALVGKWRFNVGAMQDVAEQQIRQEAAFIIENFPHLKIDEFNLVIKLATTGKLNAAIYYGSFSSKYIADVLNAYQIYSQELQKILVSKKPRIELRATPTERADSMRYMIGEVAAQMKAKKAYVFMINYVFDYLRKAGKISLDDQMVKDAKEYADKKITSLNKVKSQPEFKSMRSVLEPGYSADNKDNLRLQFVNEYLVRLCYNKITVKKLIEDVSEKEFQD